MMSNQFEFILANTRARYKLKKLNNNSQRTNQVTTNVTVQCIYILVIITMILIRFLIIKIRSCTADTWGRMLWNLPDNPLKKKKKKCKKANLTASSVFFNQKGHLQPIALVQLLLLVSTTKLSKLRSIHATRSQLQHRVCPPAFTKQKVSHT